MIVTNKYFSPPKMDEDKVAVDSLSYKELQALAMSLNLPGKMKAEMLMEAITARQNHDEEAVAAVLEAHNQRLTMLHLQQLEKQQSQMFLKIPSASVLNPPNPKTTYVSKKRHRRKASVGDISTESSTTNPSIIGASSKRSRREKMPKHSPLNPLLPEQKEKLPDVTSLIASHDSSWSFLLDQQRSTSAGQQTAISFNDSGCWMPSSSPWESSTAQPPLMSSSQLDSVSSSNLFDEDLFGAYTTYSPEEMLNND